MDHKEELKNHILESFGLQIEELPDYMSLHFIVDYTAKQVEIPIYWDEDGEIAVIYRVEGHQVLVMNHHPTMINETYDFRYGFEALTDLVRECWTEIMGKEPGVVHQGF